MCLLNFLSIKTAYHQHVHAQRCPHSDSSDLSDNGPLSQKTSNQLSGESHSQKNSPTLRTVKLALTSHTISNKPQGGVAHVSFHVVVLWSRFLEKAQTDWAVGLSRRTPTCCSTFPLALTGCVGFVVKKIPETGFVRLRRNHWTCPPTLR